MRPWRSHAGTTDRHERFEGSGPSSGGTRPCFQASGLTGAAIRAHEWEADPMTTGSPGLAIRIAGRQEFGRLREVEEASEQLFTEVGIGPFRDEGEPSHLERAAIVLVSGDPPVGFASVEIVDGAAHLSQLSVHPSASRRGRGSALLTAVCDWAAAQGYQAVTLTTFRDVSWNGPFYARMGFHVLDDLTPQLAAIRDHEKAIGDDDFGPRVAMRKDLHPTPSP